ncbi:hypothetical protein J624_3612 [Acinetobacter baumannii 1062314]|nr:hypothetical protein J624_3612 [Acinetobacter baumannii 1062314]
MEFTLKIKRYKNSKIKYLKYIDIQSKVNLRCSIKAQV